ncbi:hypothetical protein C8F01DRAFT_1257895 [Mycena amicta]|nr:hypothetical protein C8F01DRAFT_1257895 [Mycena amicta]
MPASLTSLPLDILHHEIAPLLTASEKTIDGTRSENVNTDLIVLARTCRLLHEACIPLLYKSVSCSTGSRVASWMQALTARKEYGKFVHKLDLNMDSEKGGRRAITLTSKGVGKLAVAIASCTTNLRYLRLTNLPELPPILVKIGAHFPFLEQLSLSDQPASLKIFAAHPTVEYFSLGRYCGTNLDEDMGECVLERAVKYNQRLIRFSGPWFRALRSFGIAIIAELQQHRVVIQWYSQGQQLTELGMARKETPVPRQYIRQFTFGVDKWDAHYLPLAPSPLHGDLIYVRRLGIRKDTQHRSLPEDNWELSLFLQALDLVVESFPFLEELIVTDAYGVTQSKAAYFEAELSSLRRWESSQLHTCQLPHTHTLWRRTSAVADAPWVPYHQGRYNEGLAGLVWFFCTALNMRGLSCPRSYERMVRRLVAGGVDEDLDLREALMPAAMHVDFPCTYRVGLPIEAYYAAEDQLDIMFGKATS